MADFSPEDTFERLKQTTAKTIQDYFPVKGAKQTLEVQRVWVDDDKHIDDLRSQKDAKTKGRTWSVPINAELVLRDNATNRVMDTQTMTVAQLPKTTRRHSFIVDGNEWQVNNQFRLKSGVYTRIKENGELEGQWNLEKGKGFRMGFDPKTRKLSLEYGTAAVPLYPVLKTLGVSDDAIEKKWGKEILTENMGASTDRTLRQLHKSMIGTNAPVSLEDTKKAVLEQFERTKLRPDSTAITLGHPFDAVHGQSLLAGSEKILKVSRQEVEPDDRDGLQFKDFLSVEDMIHERLAKDARRDITRKLTGKIDRNPRIREIINPDILGKPIRTFFTNSSITERPDQTNPLGFIGGARKTTLGGEHGIADPHKITLEARSIHPSHFGFIDPIQTPESEGAGTVLQMASGSKKVGKEIHQHVFDMKAGKSTYIAPAMAMSSNVAFPDQYRWENGKPVPLSKDVKVMDTRGQISRVDHNKVDFVVHSTKHLFDLPSNMIPFLQSDQGNRSTMAAKQMEQAVPLKNREQPLVQVKGFSGTFEEQLGKLNSHHALVDGHVHEVLKDAVIIKDAGGKKHEVQIYDHFPLNDNKGVLHSTPIVAKGAAVKAGQLIADTNFTRDGKLALGANLKVAFIPYRGYNFEDGIVISESAAKKMTSEHMHREGMRVEDNTILNRNKFLAETAGQYKTWDVEHLDEKGIVKPGTIVKPGAVLVGALKLEDHTNEQKQLALFSKKTLKPVTPKPVVWDKDYAGEVTQVVHHGKDVTVYVKTHTPAEIGDKLVGRHGNKGIISKIIPDHEMPHDEHGQPMEILLNPAGIISRINVGQVLETVASKIARKTGKPYVVENFDPNNKDYTRNLHAELERHGLTDKQAIFDPLTNKKLGDVLTGEQYMLKLHHTAEKGIVARSRGAYDVNMTPRQGGPQGGQTMDISGMYALLAHGARENVREMQTVKSDMNDDFWMALQSGESIPAPKIPFAYRKFEGYLKALGVNPVKDGNGIHLTPLTDQHVLKMSNGELTDPAKAVRGKDVKPEPGGIFDPKVTGTTWPAGKMGENWSHIKLAARFPNPMFEEPIQTLIGLKGQDFHAVMAGTREHNGLTGPAAIAESLKKIDVKKEIGSLEESLSSLRGNKLNDATKKLKYLRALDKVDLNAHDAYTLQHLPVIPPAMRPLGVLPDGRLNEDDLNGLYRHIGMTNDQLKNFDWKLMPHEEAHPLHQEIYDGLKALMLTGLTQRGRHRRGILETVSGKGKGGPKEGFFQDKLIGRRQDLSMRGVIVPEPSLGLDEVAIPRKAAEEIYKPFVVQRMVRAGSTPLQAQQEVKKGTPLAQAHLEAEVKERPLLLKRDPVLHKYGVQAFKPILTTGSAIKIHPLVTAGYNADFDGDKMSAFVPVSHKAVEEAWKMLPSRNVFSPSDGKLMPSPRHESMLGLFKLSRFGRDTSHTFATGAEAARAVADGKVGMNDVVTIQDPHALVKYAAVGASKPVRTSVGRLLLHQALPEQMRNEKFLTDRSYELTGKQLVNVLSDVGRNHDSETFGHTADRLKNLGNEYATGLSFGLADLHALTGPRDAILKKAAEEEKKIRARNLLPKELDQHLVKLYGEASKHIQEVSKKHFDEGNNPVYDWVRSGARGNWDQFKQMAVAPMQVVDSKGRTIPTPITKSYSEGLDTASYWAGMHGARMGLIGKRMSTELPGAQFKQMVQTSLNQLVTSDDCGTNKGLLLHVDDTNALDRFTSADINIGERGGKDKGIIPAGTLVSPDVISRLKNNKIKDVPVRTPLKCQETQGICAKCYGLHANGQMHPKGTNLGIIATHALGEPLTQLAMRSSHEGGTAGSKGAGAINQFIRLKQLVEFPSIVPGSATLSEAHGTVHKIEEDKAAGGWHVHIGHPERKGTIPHFVPSRRELSVKVGQTVDKGQPLSSGPINPRELLQLTNISAVQRYLTDELQKVYGSSSALHRRNTEVFVRALTNLSHVDDPGDHEDLLKGDHVTTSAITAHNSKLPSGKRPVQFTPILKGTNVLPNEMQEDWMARLQHRDLTRTLHDAAAEGLVSNLHGTHPIPGMAYGVEFGQGTHEAPWMY